MVSCSDWDNTLRVWDTTSYQCVSIINKVNCPYSNGILDLGNDIIIVGGNNKIIRINIKLPTVETVIDDKSI